MAVGLISPPLTSPCQEGLTVIVIVVEVMGMGTGLELGVILQRTATSLTGLTATLGMRTKAQSILV